MESILKFGNLLFIVIGLVVGYYAKVLIQKLQSKEILKQILYKEKITAYRQLLDSATELERLLLNDPKYINMSKADIEKAVYEFQFSIGKNSHILSLDSYDSLYLFGVEARKVLNKKTEPISLAAPYGKITISIRKDLGTKELSRELLDLYLKFPAISFAKSKNEN